MSTTPSDVLLERWAPLATVQGCQPLRAHRASDLFGLWQAWETESGLSLSEAPFWGIVWPGAKLLARYLSDHRGLVEGKEVVDIGCGGAVAAIAAARCGARRVVACDIDPAALSVAERNGRANDVTLENRSRPVEGREDLEGVDVVLIADFFYQRDASERMLALLHAAVAVGVDVLIADAGRPFAPREGVTLLHEEPLAVDSDVEGVATRHTRLMRLLAPRS